MCEVGLDDLEAKAQEQRFRAFQEPPAARVRPSSAPARAHVPQATEARQAARAKAQSVFGSWWKAWLGDKAAPKAAPKASPGRKRRPERATVAPKPLPKELRLSLE